MTQLVLTEDQERLLGDSDADVEVRNSSGVVIGTLIREQANGAFVEVSPEVAQILIERMSMENPEWRTTEQVLERLKQIDSQCGG